MIGKPEWFKRRKYTGWGLTPKTWQGWAYIVLMAAPIALFQYLLDPTTFQTAAIVWVGVIVVDVLDMMMNLEMDEREKQHEAIAERNAAWIMIILVAGGLIYELATTKAFDPVLLVVMAGGLLAKGITNWKLGREN